MREQEYINYRRVADAITYIQQHFKEQPSLDEIAAHIHVSPYHFQRIFTEWAGVSPKKFLQFISVRYAKEVIREKQITLFDTADDLGLSGTGRLHDLFVTIEGMTPGAYKNEGEYISIQYSYAPSPFGEVLVASTTKGICHMAFIKDKTSAFKELQQRFPKANFIKGTDAIQQNALRIYDKDWSNINEVKLHLKGTDFQLKVWEALLKIPMGELSTYGSLAERIKNPKASRAVGTAIGSNPVAFIIPCHRVIQSSGALGGYMWGATRKTAIIGWEAAKVNP